MQKTRWQKNQPSTNNQDEFIEGDARATTNTEFTITTGTLFLLKDN